MPPPLKIILGALLVVLSLLLSERAVCGDNAPLEKNASSDRNAFRRNFDVRNASRLLRNKPKNTEIALNELEYKDSTSDEQNVKDSKYKQRGRVRFGESIRPSTESVLRRNNVSTTKSNIIIVTPTPEAKKPTQIIDSMREYKRSKITKTPLSDTSIRTPTKSISEIFESSESQADKNYVSQMSNESNNDNTNRKSNSARINSNLNSDEGSGEINNEKNSNLVTEISTAIYEKPKNVKNELFSRKYNKVVSKIQKHSEYRNFSDNLSKFNVAKNNIVESPKINSSSLFIKKTIETHFLDNEDAASSDAKVENTQSTSISYELSDSTTNLFNVDLSESEECDNDTTSSESTVTQSSENDNSDKTNFTSLEQFAHPNLKTKQVLTQPLLSLQSTFTTLTPFSTWKQHSIKPFTNNPVTSYNGRNEEYLKRLNFNTINHSFNSITLRPNEAVSYQSFVPNQVTSNYIRPSSPRFHYTSPRSRPVWMAPKHNVTRISNRRPSTPATIYSEHFDVNDRYSTVSPEIHTSEKVIPFFHADHIRQNDIVGLKKIVKSKNDSDNSIPSLWKRGSMKYTTTTTTESPDIDLQTENKDLEIPPTLAAWALASLKSPPASRDFIKGSNKNELQLVNVTDKKESSTVNKAPDLVTVTLPIKNVVEDNENKLQWRPTEQVSNSTTTYKLTNNTVLSSLEKTTDKNNIQVTTGIDETQSDNINKNNLNLTDKKEFNFEKTTTNDVKTANDEEAFETSFISTKHILDNQNPAENTNSLKDKAQNIFDNLFSPSENNYEITTIRFNYFTVDYKKSTEESSNNTVDTLTKTTVLTQSDDLPITTYRPMYVSKDKSIEDTTSYSNGESDSDHISSMTNTIRTLPEKEETNQISTVKSTLHKENETISSDSWSDSNNNITAKIVIEVVTEISTAKQRFLTTPVQTSSTEVNKINLISTNSSQTLSVENSDSNEVITQENKLTSTSDTIKVTTESSANAMTTDVKAPEAETTENLKVITMSSEPESSSYESEDISSIENSISTVAQFSVNGSSIIEELSTTQKFDSLETTSAIMFDATENITKSVNNLEDISNYEVPTTETSSQVLEHNESGAAMAVIVSAIGVIALIMLVGLLVVARRRGRRGMFAQRCTPVSLDAYSLDSVSAPPKGLAPQHQRHRASKRSYGNPAYDDEVTSHPMGYAALANFAQDVESMTAEFLEIPSVSVRPDEVPAGCEDKNRYSNVLPLPETRVPLKRIGNDPTTEYINANYITGPGNIKNYYILCQAPLANTVADFWRMVWEQRARVLVMLTEYMENGVEKCYEYLPPSEITDNKRTFGGFQVVLKRREQRDKYAIACVQLTHVASRRWREVTHLWYFWPAKGVPDDYNSVIEFLLEMRSSMKLAQSAKEYDDEGMEVSNEDARSNSASWARGEGQGIHVYSPARAEGIMRRNQGTLGGTNTADAGVFPCVVVCASGAGRSAALVALDLCARALQARSADVPRVVRELRAQRPHALSNKHHYIFVYRALSEYGNKIMGGGPDV